MNKEFDEIKLTKDIFTLAVAYGIFLQNSEINVKEGKEFKSNINLIYDVNIKEDINISVPVNYDFENYEGRSDIGIFFSYLYIKEHDLKKALYTFAILRELQGLKFARNNISIMPELLDIDNYIEKRLSLSKYKDISSTSIIKNKVDISVYIIFYRIWLELQNM